MTGYRAFSYGFVKTFPVLSQGFEIETEMTIHAIDKNMSIENVIVEYKDRPDGSESKLNTVSDGIKVLYTMMKLWKNYRPFHFFSVLSLILLLVDTAVFVPLILIPFINTGLVLRIPTLVVCGFVALAAILSFFSGTILDVIIQKEKREFEFRRQLLSGNNEKD